MTDAPVAVFDSGVGGLSVLRHLRAILPGESLLYLADQDHAPYGEQTLADVRQRAVAISGALIAAGAKTVVVACNSASAAALHHLRATFPDVPFVGMEPALKPAALSSRRGTVGVLATDATFQGELFASLLDRHARGVAVIARSCPGLAKAVEDHDLADRVVLDLVKSYVLPVVERGADVIVLGCTHYAFLAGVIGEVAGPDVHIIDPAPAVARRVAAVLAEADLAAGPGVGRTGYRTTGSPAVLAAQVQRLLGELPEEVESMEV